MFDNLKNLAGLPGMLAKAREMQAKMQEVQGKLGDLRAEADAGGGMVTATCNGKLELVRLKIDPARLDPSKAKPEDLELLEDLIVVAVNDMGAHLPRLDAWATLHPEKIRRWQQVRRGNAGQRAAREHRAVPMRERRSYYG